MTAILQHGLDLSHTNDNLALNKIIRGSIKRKGRTGHVDEPCNTFAWPATLFFLNHSRLFKKLSSEDQHQVIKACNDFILSESYFIEKAGLAYCAKMILLAETTEIRQMYGLIASDESVHLQWLLPYVPESLRTSPQGQFIHAITQMIEQCNANTLYFLVQTILEGWGVSYYKTLAANCQLPMLQQTLLDIVKDEAVHHKTGKALFNPEKITRNDEIHLYDGMKCYADILKLSTQNIVKCVENVIGTLSFQQRIELFEDLESEMTAKIKLALLKDLMQHPKLDKFLARLEEEGYFTPYSAKACAEIYR